MGNAVVDLLLVWIRFVVGLADTFGDNLRVTLAVAGVFAIRALHASGILQKVATKSTAHDIVELLCNELVALFLVNLFFLLADGSLTVETNVERSSILQLLGFRMRC